MRMFFSWFGVVEAVGFADKNAASPIRKAHGRGT
jgi:hypothetical protein